MVVIGGGRAGLAAAFHLRRRGVEFVVLDAQPTPGGAWPQVDQVYPDAGHVVSYLADYEKRYDWPVQRPVRVQGIPRDGAFLRVETDSGTWLGRHVISATGTWWRPFLPAVTGAFTGTQPHTVDYRQEAGRALSDPGQSGMRGEVGGDLRSRIAAADHHPLPGEVLWRTTSVPP